MKETRTVYHAEPNKTVRNNNRMDRQRHKSIDIQKDDYIFYVPNPYNLCITITPNKKPSDEVGLLVPFADLPFYVLKRGYMKTVYNLINDVLDDLVYAAMSNPNALAFDPEFRKNTIDEYLSTHNITKVWKVFDMAANGKTAGVKLTTDLPGNVFTRTDIDGNVITWYVDKRERPKYKALNEYTAIEKDKLKDMVDFLYGTLTMEYQDMLTIHQIAAIEYLRAVTTDYKAVVG